MSWHRATFHRETLPRIRKLMLACWRDAMSANGEERARMAKAVIELSEFRRQLLGFPSPGRRRNEGEREERNISVPVVSESAPAPALEPSPDQSAAPAPAPE